jgi:hypothetical protein
MLPANPQSNNQAVISMISIDPPPSYRDVAIKTQKPSLQTKNYLDLDDKENPPPYRINVTPITY